jgi:hypothetical protein
MFHRSRWRARPYVSLDGLVLAPASQIGTLALECRGALGASLWRQYSARLVGTERGAQAAN